MDFPSNAELIEIIKNGEDSTVEFKKEFNNREQNFAAELVAFANSKGGFLLLGVGDDGSIYGIERNHLSDLKNKISNLCNEIKPPIDPVFKIYSLDNKQILVILVESGQEKPYCTNKIDYWVKRGDSKRKAAPSDLRRLVKEGAKITENERITAADIENALHESKFRIYFETYYLTQSNQGKVPLKQLIQNFRLADNGKLNVAGLLLFGKQIQNYLPNANDSNSYNPYQSSSLEFGLFLRKSCLSLHFSPQKTCSQPVSFISCLLIFPKTAFSP